MATPLYHFRLQAVYEQAMILSKQTATLTVVTLVTYAWISSSEALTFGW